MDTSELLITVVQGYIHALSVQHHIIHSPLIVIEAQTFVFKWCVQWVWLKRHKKNQWF